MKPKYRYRCKVIRVIDGDSLVIDVDLGLYIHQLIKVRLAGVNAPEPKLMERAAGLAAKAFVEEWVRLHTDFLVDTNKDRTGKFGRYIAELWGKKNGNGNAWSCLNDQLIANDHAVRVSY